MPNMGCNWESVDVCQPLVDPHKTEVRIQNVQANRGRLINRFDFCQLSLQQCLVALDVINVRNGASPTGDLSLTVTGWNGSTDKPLVLPIPTTKAALRLKCRSIGERLSPR